MLKDYSGFKYNHGSRFPGQSKDKICVFIISVDLPGSGVDLVKPMQVGGDVEISWIRSDHVKHMKDGPPLRVMCMIASTVRC